MNIMVETNEKIHQVQTHNELRDKSLTLYPFFKKYFVIFVGKFLP